MSTTIDRYGIAELTGKTFGKAIRVTGFAGRSPVPSWWVECQICHTQWRCAHKSLQDGGSALRCQNTSCAKGVYQKPQERVEREPEPLPATAPAKSALEREHDLYARYMREQGFSDSQIGSWDDWQRLGPESRKRLLEPALMAEAAKVRKQELEALGLAFKNAEESRVRKTYGEG